MTTVTKSITFKWKLSFNDNYQWSTENKLYNVKTMREIKKTVNGYSVGYWINKKFYTLENLRKHLVKIEKIKIGKTSKAELYTVSIAPLWYFLFYSDSLIFSTSDILSFETIIDDSKVFYDIRTYSLENYVMRKDTSYLVPTIYKYSRISKKYEKNSK